MKNFDCIVVGKGPAGISASIYAHTAGRSCLVVGEDGGALVQAERISNFYGTGDVTGKDLFLQGQNQAIALGVEVVTAEVTALTMVEGGFEVTTPTDKFFGRTVVLACGVKRDRLKVKGVDEFDGKGVSYCAVCDGFLYREREVAVVGGGAYAKEEAEHLAGIGCKVTVFTQGEPEVDFGDVPTVADAVEEIVGERRVNAIVAGGKAYPTSAVFVAVGKAGGVDFARTVGLMSEGAYLVVDKNMMTNCPGIFACGDVTGGLLQVATAVAEGALAGKAVNAYLKSVNK